MSTRKKRVVPWPAECWSAEEIAAHAQEGDMITWRGAHPINASRTEAHRRELEQHLAEKGLRLDGLVIRRAQKTRQRRRR